MMKYSHLKGAESRNLSAIPSLTSLQAFERAALNLSFQRAARDLALTPSAVSHRIRGLEQRFGVRLFARAGRAIKLTTAGQKYLDTVRSSLAALERSSRDLQLCGTAAQEVLRISALPYFTSTVIIPALGDFQRRFPGISLRVETTNQYADFDQAGVDVAIRYGRQQSAGLRFDPLIEVSSIPVCAPKLARQLRTPVDLASQTLIHLTVQPSAWPAWLRQAGVHETASRGELWFDNVLSALDAAEQGFGVALAMRPLVDARRANGRSLAMPFDVRTSTSERFYMVFRSEHARTKRMIVLRRWLKDAIKQATRRRASS